MKKREYPKISIGSLVQRANDLVTLCRADKGELEPAGLQWDLVNEIALLLKECSEADAKFKILKENLILERNNLRKFIKDCKNLRSCLAEMIRKSFHTIGTEVRLPQYYKNWNPEDIVQDLNDLAHICNNRRDELVKTNFDFSLSEKAAEVVPELSHYLAKIKLTQENSVSDAFEYRNRVYNELYMKMKQICFYGRRAFWDEPEHRKYYRAVN